MTARCWSSRSSWVADDHRAHQQVLEVGGVVDVAGEAGEEVFELAHPQRLEQHVLAAGEHAVERGPRHAGLGGDVVDGDLGDAPALDAALGAVEHARLDRAGAGRGSRGRGRGHGVRH